MTGTPLEYQSAPPRLPHSGAGIASLIVGLLCFIALFLSLVVSTGPRARLSPTIAVLIALGYFLSPVLGLVLGIIGTRSKQRRRVTALIGVILNGLVLLLWIGLIALAFALRNS